MAARWSAKGTGPAESDPLITLPRSKRLRVCILRAAAVPLITDPSREVTGCCHGPRPMMDDESVYHLVGLIAPTLAWTSAADRSSGVGDIISALGGC